MTALNKESYDIIAVAVAALGYLKSQWGSWQDIENDDHIMLRLTIAIRSAPIAVISWHVHMTLQFMTASLSNGVAGSD